MVVTKPGPTGYIIMKQTDKDIAIAALKELVKPGYTISGVQMPTSSRDHVARVFVSKPHERYTQGSHLMEITNEVNAALGWGRTKTGIKMSSNRHGSATSAFRYMVEMLSHELFPDAPPTDTLWSELF